MLVGLDCDGVLFNFVSHLRKMASLDAHWMPDRMNCFDTLDNAGDRMRAEIAMTREGFARMMPLYPGARAQVERLVEAGIKFCYVTKPCPGSRTWCADRADAIQALLPGAPIVFTADKYLTRCDVLIDDCAETCDRFRLETGRPALQIARPWNGERGYTLKEAIDTAMRIEAQP